MTAVQNFKNFPRHGKRARVTHSPHTEPATNMLNVHAQHQRYNHGRCAVSDPNIMDHKPLQANAPAGNFPAVAVNNQNQAARAGDAATRAAGDHHKAQAHAKADDTHRKAKPGPLVLERIVAEEREQKAKLPKDPCLQRWILLEKMGDGAFSNVYRAKDSQGQYPECALKVVRKFGTNSRQFCRAVHFYPAAFVVPFLRLSSQGGGCRGQQTPSSRFQEAPNNRGASILKEAQIMRQLNHSNIVKLIDFSESRQNYYIILELCPGGELFHQIVRLTYFSKNLSRHVIIQVAKALEYLHEVAGVVHRDIKPENLLFYPVPFIPTENPKPKPSGEENKVDEGEFIKGVGAGTIGTVKVADFGLSKVIWDSQTMTPCGTVGYTAPEIVNDERYSKSVDMWALGCVLYTLLCGFPPFYDESVQTLTEKVARGQYTFLSPWWDDISKSAQDLVSHLLTVDPEMRYDIKQFLNHPWIREAGGETYAAADTPPLAMPFTKETSEQPIIQPSYADLDDHPNAGGRRMDFLLPGATNLREVFGVSYTVHRQEERDRRCKNFKQRCRGANAMPSLNALDEEGMCDNDEDRTTAPFTANQADHADKLSKHQIAEVSAVAQKLKNTTMSAAVQNRQQAAGQVQQRGYDQHSPAVAAAAMCQARNKGAFELSLDNTTLLGRRQRKHELSSQRKQAAVSGP
ncbi:kinase-like domain-containing protein [Macrophomina phaseolina]|uniref:Kinase-like domain-containing protein n=1 Tax=Macrophomina phaseolina TaxID=35725 RepID=A0ABQ8FVH3_9PEZI|nr:kinase-like domain-containing protein [Macrophomina phaseolina]